MANMSSEIATELLHIQTRKAMLVKDLEAILPADHRFLENSVLEGTALSFSGILQDVIQHVDQMQHRAEDTALKVSRGESDDLIGAVLSSQRANLSFSLLTEFRNKIMGATNNLLEMQL